MEDNKKNRGLGKGLSELLGEARAKAAISKQVKTESSETDHLTNPATINKIKDNDFDEELDMLHNISSVAVEFETQDNKIKKDADIIDNDILKEDTLSSIEPHLIEEDDTFETITSETIMPEVSINKQEENYDVEFNQENFTSKQELNSQVELSEHKIDIIKKQDNDIVKRNLDVSSTQKKQEKNTSIINQPTGHNKKDIIHYLPIELVNPNKEQPRKFFDTNDLNDLAESIKIYGVIQPILVKERDNEYIIVAGERRWRASQIAGLKTIPAIIVNYTEDEILEVALIENIQRANLTPIDEAKAYYYLIQKYELTQNELSLKIGKSRSYIANMIRLLELDDNVKNYLETGELSIGHARVLVGVKNAADLAEKIIKSHMSVRKVEELIAQLSEKQNVRLPKALNTGKNTDILALEADLRAALGVNVSINSQTAQKGNLIIRYESLDQLDEVCRRLCSNWGADVA